VIPMQQLLSSFCMGTRRRCGISTDLDGSAEWLRHDSRIHRAALVRTKSFVDQMTLSADSGLVQAAVSHVA
jgi:hypothetical protein